MKVPQPMDPTTAASAVGEPVQPRRVILRTRRTMPAELIRQRAMYSRCPCGSGRKFKFCCHKKQP